MVPTVRTKLGMEVNFFTGQALTGHGCFKYFRWKIGKIQSAECAVCEGIDETAEHVIMECPRFNKGRPVEMDIGKEETCKYLESVVKTLWAEENGPKSIK